MWYGWKIINNKSEFNGFTRWKVDAVVTKKEMYLTCYKIYRSISSNDSNMQMHYTESAGLKLRLNDWKNGSSLEETENSCVLSNQNGSPKLK